LVIAVIIVAALPAPPLPIETIIYRAGSCFGTCPEYSFTVSSDGRGVFTGKHYVSVIGDRSFSVTPAQFKAFRRHLAAYQGRKMLISSSSFLCPDYMVDGPSIEVTWMTNSRLTGHVFYDDGCPKPKIAPDMVPTLESAPALLPLAELIGSRWDASSFLRR
jgi:hypothetical protein